MVCGSFVEEKKLIDRRFSSCTEVRGEYIGPRRSRNTRSRASGRRSHRGAAAGGRALPAEPRGSTSPVTVDAGARGHRGAVHAGSLVWGAKGAPAPDVEVAEGTRLEGLLRRDGEPGSTQTMRGCEPNSRDPAAVTRVSEQLGSGAIALARGKRCRKASRSRREVTSDGLLHRCDAGLRRKRRGRARAPSGARSTARCGVSARAQIHLGVLRDGERARAGGT